MVDNEHKNVFKDKIFLSFRRARNLKDELVRARLQNLDDEWMEKGTFRCNYGCNGRKSCQVCPLMREGDPFQDFNSTKSFKTFSGKHDCISKHVVYLLQCECCSRKYVGSTETKFRQRFNVYKSYFRSYSRKHSEGSLDKGKPIPQASFFGHFFENGHNGKFTDGTKTIDGAEDVNSLQRKELYWQYRLEKFSPKKDLNERAADVESDIRMWHTTWTITSEWCVCSEALPLHFLCYPLVTSCLSVRSGRVDSPIGLSRIQNSLKLFSSQRIYEKLPLGFTGKLA